MNLAASFEPNPRPVYLLVHEAAAIRGGALDAILDAVRPQLGLEAFNHSTFRAGEAGPDAITTARTLPMMADRRLVVVRGIDEGDKRFFGALLEYLTDPADSCTLVLMGPKFPKVVKGGKQWGRAVKKAVAAVGYVLDAKPPPPRKLVAQRAQRLGKAIQPRAAALLVEVIGPRPDLLEREVEKLVDYAGEASEITESDVAAVCTLVAESEVHALVVAMASRNRDNTLATLTRLLSEGHDPRRLLALISWKMRSISIAVDALSQGASDSVAAKAAKMRGHELKRIKPVIASEFQSPERIMSKLARANFDMNNHRAGAERILERLVMEWAG